MIGWVAGLVLIAAHIGWWKPQLTTDTGAWFFSTALVLMFNVEKALRQEGFLRQSFLGILKVTAFVEVFINLYVFSLPFELMLLPALTILLMLSVVAGTEERLSRVKTLVDGVVALIGFALFAYVTLQIMTNWQDFDTTGALLEFALPAWLTIGIIPFIYLVGLYMAYDGAFRFIDGATSERDRRCRAKLALALRLHVRIQDIAAFRFYWIHQAVNATTFGDASRAVKEFKTLRERKERTRIEAQHRLRQYAGVDGYDENGLRLDQCEFKETKDALRTLAAAQMGWYRNRGGRYRYELLDILQLSLEHDGLPPDNGISLHVADDGQSWWAYRRTITGWCFAIGAAAPPPDQWLYDGAEPPTGPPGEDGACGEGWGVDAKNW
jgi:hypothetical protein